MTSINTQHKNSAVKVFLCMPVSVYKVPRKVILVIMKKCHAKCPGASGAGKMQKVIHPLQAYLLNGNIGYILM